MPEKEKSEPISHRYNRLPLLQSRPGGIRQELVVSTRQYKSRTISLFRKRNQLCFSARGDFSFEMPLCF